MDIRNVFDQKLQHVVSIVGHIHTRESSRLVDDTGGATRRIVFWPSAGRWKGQGRNFFFFFFPDKRFLPPELIIAIRA